MDDVRCAPLQETYQLEGRHGILRHAHQESRWPPVTQERIGKSVDVDLNLIRQRRKVGVIPSARGIAIGNEYSVQARQGKASEQCVHHLLGATETMIVA